MSRPSFTSSAALATDASSSVAGEMYSRPTRSLALNAMEPFCTDRY
jgi:hypothetical protein